MQIKTSFKHLEHTEALDQKIQEKSEKLKKYFDGNFEIQWTCYVQENVHHADIKLIGPSFEYHAKSHADQLYKCFDLAINKIEKQIWKKKDKWKQHISHKHAPSVKDKQIRESEKDEEFWEDKRELKS